MPVLVDFCQNPPPTFDYPKDDRRITGNPLRTTWTHYSSAGTDYGIWACEPGAWRIAFSAHKEEFFQVIEGRIRIHDSQGEKREFGPGDACVIPAGFCGTFEVLETVRKYFVVIDKAAC